MCGRGAHYSTRLVSSSFPSVCSVVFLNKDVFEFVLIYSPIIIKSLNTFECYILFDPSFHRLSFLLLFSPFFSFFLLIFILSILPALEDTHVSPPIFGRTFLLSPRPNLHDQINDL